MLGLSKLHFSILYILDGEFVEFSTNQTLMDINKNSYLFSIRWRVLQSIKKTTGLSSCPVSLRLDIITW